MEPLEANKIIAEFMGSHYINEPFKDSKTKEMVDFWHWSKPIDGFPRCQVTGIEWSTAFMIENFKYHTSWDWLMPVWLKIAKWGWDKHEHYWQQNIGRDAIVIKNFLDINILIPVQFGEITIDAVYTAVVEFIKWHNTQTKVV